jgi:histidinol-phosphate/aromatic aminotransferase/cobyric acid decarboxylase-like protein
MLGIIGLIGGLSIWAISNQNVRDAKQRYEKWKEQIAEIEREEEEIKRNRLSRSFKSDDLFVFYEVMTKITSAVITYKLIKQGAVVKDSKEQNFVEQFIPKSKKDMFDDF